MPDKPLPTVDSNNSDAIAPPRPVTQRPVTQRQVPPQRWQIFPAQKAQSKQISQATALSPLLAQVLINRGIYTPEQAWEFLDPETLLLPSPLDEFPDLNKSLDLLVKAIEIKEKILICGDYDADGMTSTALLMRSLRYLGASVDYAIPSRMDEGYGINDRIVEDFHASGGSIILTVDNGIAAYDPIARARELDLTVILTDHHAVPEKIPPANAILNPQLIREASPYRGVAGVGVAYILAVCLAQRMDKMQDLTATLLALFTLGTIADLAPLTGVNRRWVKRGLKLLPKSRIPGIQALIEVAGLSEETALKPEAIGFRLGPRINAVGRIADPQIVIDLLTTDDVGVALQRAMQCEEANQLRRQMCEIIEQQAVDWCEDQMDKGLLDLQKERVLVVVQPEWHHGVIGIVASRLVERYGVPVFIGTYEDKAKKEIRGSARSIPEFNVVEALRFCDDLLGKYGGHRAAGGFSFAANKLRQVKSRLSNFACKHLQPEHLKPLVTADVQTQLAEVDGELYTQIDQIQPCGIENSEPVFWTANVAVVEQRVIGKTSAHLKLTLAQTSTESEDNGTDSEKGGEKTVIKAIAWRWGHYYPLPRALDIAYKLRLNDWKGQRSIELELVGVRAATRAEQSPSGIRPWSADAIANSSKKTSEDTLASPRKKPSTPPEKTIESESGDISNPDASVGKIPSAQLAKEVAQQLQQELNGKQTSASSNNAVSFKLENPPSRQAHSKPAKTHTPTASTTVSLQTEPGIPTIQTEDLEAPSAKPAIESESESENESDAPHTISGLEPGLGKGIENLEASMHVEFYHSQRRYKGTLEKTDGDSQLTIQNADAHLLIVQMSERKGFLYLPDKVPLPVDIADQKYFNLIRAGLNALEAKQKTQLLIKKDELLAEKDAQISTMKAQIELLEEKITQLSTEQQQQFADLKTELESQENAIQGQEAHIEQLQVQVSTAPLPTSADLKQQVRDAVGDGVWFCLQASSQKDLQAAYKNYQTLHISGPDAHIADYSEAGIRLSRAIEREIMKPFFQDLYAFAKGQGKTSLGNIGLGLQQTHTLSQVPPLLAQQWRSFPPGELGQQLLREAGVTIVKVKAIAPISESDLALLSQFFGQWEHPMATCFKQKGPQAASSLDQISKLQSIAIHQESFLYRWQYELLHQLIAGKEGRGGLLRQVFSQEKSTVNG